MTGAHPIGMHLKSFARFISILFIGCAMCLVLAAQQRRRVQYQEEDAYGSKFFDQLHAIFGKFRDMDLQRVFQEAQSIQCSELVGRKGEWRPVAFFNENRRLGDWCRESLDEVKGDLTVYTFKGQCGGGQGTVEVTTEFPTTESIEAYQNRRIELNDVDITVNDPVKATLNPTTMAYTFDLPYLFLTDQQGSSKTYSFNAPTRNSSYARDVSCRWECKAVSSKDVTYRFLICRTATIPRGQSSRNQRWEPSFGSSAFFILSDGMETHTSVKVLYGDGTEPAKNAEEEPPSPGTISRPVLKRPSPEK